MGSDNPGRAPDAETLPPDAETLPPAPDQPGYGASAPTAPARRHRPRRLVAAGGGILLIAIVAAVAVVAGSALNPSHAGQVVFTTDMPTSESAKTCQFGHQVTSVSAGTPVYAIYFYKALLANETVTLTVSKDGTPIAQNAVAPLDSNGVDCSEDPLDIRTFVGVGAGRYEFKMTTEAGEIVSDGTLIIEEPTPRPTRRPVTPTGHAGQVVFTTDMPTSESAARCKLGHEVTSVTVGTPVYATYFYKALLVNETVTLTVSKDGTPIAQSAVARLGSNGVDCAEDPLDIRTFVGVGAGRYEFKMTTATGEIVSDGTLIIEAPTPPPSQSPAMPS